MTPETPSSYWQKRKKAFGYAFRGLASLFRNEAHAKIHAIATILVVICGFLFKITPIEWCLVLLCIGAVISAEAINTAIEKVCDAVTEQRHPLIGAAKDIAAAAVLISALISVIIAAIIFLPRLPRLL